MNGIYRLGTNRLAALERTLSAALSGDVRDPARFNSNGELRVSWVWSELEAQGITARAVDMGPFAELNVPEDLTRFRSFVRSRL